jgi:hypothetical protein
MDYENEILSLCVPKCAVGVNGRVILSYMLLILIVAIFFTIYIFIDVMCFLGGWKPRESQFPDSRRLPRKRIYLAAAIGGRQVK